jgi:hypothetical protein
VSVLGLGFFGNRSAELSGTSVSASISARWKNHLKRKLRAAFELHQSHPELLLVVVGSTGENGDQSAAKGSARE